MGADVNLDIYPRSPSASSNIAAHFMPEGLKIYGPGPINYIKNGA